MLEEGQVCKKKRCWRKDRRLRKDRGVGGRTEASERGQRQWKKDSGIEGRTEALEDGQRCWRAERCVEEWTIASEDLEALADKPRRWRRDRGMGG
mgnify:CR=1 FL=1